MSRSNDYAKRNLVEYLHYQNIIKSVAQTYQDKANTTIPQQISFTEKLKDDDGATSFFITEKLQKSNL